MEILSRVYVKNGTLSTALHLMRHIKPLRDDLNIVAPDTSDMMYISTAVNLLVCRGGEEEEEFSLQPLERGEMIFHVNGPLLASGKRK